MNLNKEFKDSGFIKQCIIAIVVAILVMGVGYALLADAITVTGTAKTYGGLDIEVTSASWSSSNGGGTSLESNINISSDKNMVTLSANNLEYPGAAVTYNVILTNVGSVDGKVKSIGLTNPNSDLEVIYNNISIGDIIASNNGTISFQVTLKWLSTSTTGFSNSNYKIVIEFEQG